MENEWLINRLINDEYVEDGPVMEKQEAQTVLKMISEKTGKTYILIININIDFDGITYDYVLDADANSSKVLIQEWDNRYL